MSWTYVVGCVVGNTIKHVVDVCRGVHIKHVVGNTIKHVVDVCRGVCRGEHN